MKHGRDSNVTLEAYRRALRRSEGRYLPDVGALLGSALTLGLGWTLIPSWLTETHPLWNVLSGVFGTLGLFSSALLLSLLLRVFKVVQRDSTLVAWLVVLLGASAFWSLYSPGWIAAVLLGVGLLPFLPLRLWRRRRERHGSFLRFFSARCREVLARLPEALPTDIERGLDSVVAAFVRLQRFIHSHGHLRLAHDLNNAGEETFVHCVRAGGLAALAAQALEQNPTDTELRRTAREAQQEFESLTPRLHDTVSAIIDGALLVDGKVNETALEAEARRLRALAEAETWQSQRDGLP